MDNIEFSANAIGVGGLMANDADFGTDVKALEDAILGQVVIEENTNAADEYKKEMARIEANLSGGDLPDPDGEPSLANASYNFVAPVSSTKEDTSFEAPSFSLDINPPAAAAFPSAWAPSDPSLNRMTQDQMKQERVDSVIRTLDVEDVDEEFSRDVEDDDKAILLQQISMLRGTLIDDGIDVSRVDEVDHRDSKEKINLIYKTLRLKNDSNRSCALAEELILAAAHAMAYLFDGEKDWFGRKPDLVGWPDTVKVKLRRVRYESATLVKDMMQDHNVSPGFRIGLELIPSMFLYSRNRKVAGDSLVSSDEYKQAISEINSY